MDRSRIQELHYITDMANVASILARGILSRRSARRAVGSFVSVRSEVLDLDGVIVADRNAASFAQFLPAAEGMAALDEDAVLARWWHESLEARQRRMAEVLVPDRVPPEYVRGAYVPDEAAARRLREQLQGRSLQIHVHPDLFFRSAP